MSQDIDSGSQKLPDLLPGHNKVEAIRDIG